jgi:hypothetical protein
MLVPVCTVVLILNIFTQVHLIYKNLVRTSRETHYVSIITTNRLMLFREIFTIYCVNHTEHTDTRCGKNAVYFHLRGRGRYSYQCALKRHVKLRNTHWSQGQVVRSQEM